jgi:uncharacterized protein with LGFP repeats
MVRASFHYHRDVQGWDDIGYNFLVDRYGQSFEGRAGGIDQAVVGAQAGGYNANSTGVGNLGSFQTVAEPAAGIGSLARLLAWKFSLHGVPAIGTVTVRVSPGGASYTPYPPNTPVTLNRVAGHRDGDATDCPGNALYNQLPQLRNTVSALAGRPARITISPGAKASPPATGRAVSGRLTYLDGTPIAAVAVEIHALRTGRDRIIGVANRRASGQSLLV